MCEIVQFLGFKDLFIKNHGRYSSIKLLYLLQFFMNKKLELKQLPISTNTLTLVRNLWFLFPLALILLLSSRHEKFIKVMGEKIII